MSALDLIATRAQADLPVTALTLYACVTPGCRHDALHGKQLDRADAARKLGSASRPAVLAARLPVREVREYLGGERDRRPLHLPARRCECKQSRLRLTRTAVEEPLGPYVNEYGQQPGGRAAIRAYLIDGGIEPRGI